MAGDADAGKPRSRRGSETRRREFQVGVRLTPEEFAILHFDRITTGLSPGELLRGAYFREHERQAEGDQRG